MALVQAIDESTYVLIDAYMGVPISTRTFADPDEALVWADDNGIEVYTGDCDDV